MVTLFSLAAILALTGLAWAMGFRMSPTLDAPTAADEAEARLAGFHATEVALAKGGRGAVVRGDDHTLALLLPLGDGWVARRLSPALVHCSKGRFTTRLDEPMLTTARLTLAACPPWLVGPA